MKCSGSKSFRDGDYCTLQTNTDVQWHHIHSGKSLERRISNFLDRYLPYDPKKTCANPLHIMQVCRHILRKRHFISRGTICVGEAVMQASQSISISFPQAIFQVAWQIFHESFKQNPTEKANGSISMRACGSCRRARRWIDTGSACEDDRDPGNHHISWLLLLGSRLHAGVAGLRPIDKRGMFW